MENNSDFFQNEDAENRDKALLLDSFIVEAPAGSGKTELLTQRFLRLLETVNNPEEVIAITFTNKAASEMKNRIIESLELASSGIAPSADQSHKITTFRFGQRVLLRSKEFKWDLLRTPSRLRIYTIDALCNSLARQLPLMSRLGTQPKISDDASSLYTEAANRTLENIDHDELGVPIIDALRYFDNNSYRLTELLVNMLAKRDQWLTYTQVDNSAQIAEAALSYMVSEELKELEAIFNPTVQNLLMPIARLAASNLPNDSKLSLLIDWQVPISPEPENLPLWQVIADFLLTKEGSPRKEAGLNKNYGFPSDEEGKANKKNLLEILNSISDFSKLHKVRSLPRVDCNIGSWEIVNSLSKLLNLAVAELWLIFQERGEVDFVEISQRAILSLQDSSGTPTDLALKLDYQIQHLLVDEFQDTSPTQIKLIQGLTQGWTGHDGRTLFAVGDPMQSIYRFRKADVGLFIRVSQEGIGEIKLTPLKLWKNYRSTSSVVEWVNHAFQEVFSSEDSILRGAISYRGFVAQKTDKTGDGVYIHPIISSSFTEPDLIDEEESADESVLTQSNIRQFEAIKIIEIINKTRNRDPNLKIAVLVRARKHLSQLVAEIRRNHRQLHFQAVEIEELANRQVVQDLLALTRALLQRADRVNWIAILRAPWCGLRLHDLVALVGNDKTSTINSLLHNPEHISRLSEDGQKRVSHFRTVIDAALRNRGILPTSRWIYGVWLMLGGANCLWEKGDVKDVHAFFQKIDQLEAMGEFTTDQLEQEVSKLYAAPDSNSDEKLVFMTIHKSKGLEFDVVIVPGLDRKTVNNDQHLLLWEEVSIKDPSHDVSKTNLLVAPIVPRTYGKSSDFTSYDYLRDLESERAKNEDARVLYVAATRAKRCLHLLGTAKKDSSGRIKALTGSFLDMLWPVLQIEFNNESSLNEDVVFQSKTDQKIEDFVPALIRLSNPRIPDGLGDVFSSDLADDMFERQTDENDRFSADVGILAHKYLELIGLQGLGAWPLEKIELLTEPMKNWFFKKGYEEITAIEGAGKVMALLKMTISSVDGQWVLKHRHIQNCELEIEIIERDLVMKKVIDRTFVENNERWIIDYKSLAFDFNPSVSELRKIAEKFSCQLIGYANLFSNEQQLVRCAVLFLSQGKLVEIDIKNGLKESR